MPNIYALADTATETLCEELMRLYHPDLDTVAATIDLVFALRDPESDSEAPTLAVNSHRAYGITKIHGLKERVLGLKDAEIVLDGDAWPSMTPHVRRSVLDHQLQYLEVRRDKNGEFVLDDLNRPILKMRQTDRSFGWFDAVAERHRAHSLECIQLQKLISESGQIYMPFVNDGFVEPSKALQVSLHGAPKKTMSPDEVIAAIEGEFK